MSTLNKWKLPIFSYRHIKNRVLLFSTKTSLVTLFFILLLFSELFTLGLVATLDLILKGEVVRDDMVIAIVTACIVTIIIMLICAAFLKELGLLKRRLLGALAISHVGSWSWNAATGGFSFSRQAMDVLGIDYAFNIPETETILSITEKKDRNKLAAYFAAFAAGKNPPAIDFDIRLSDGVRKTIQINADFSNHSDNKEILGMIQDITAIKKAEAFVQKTSDILKMVATGRPASEVYDAIALMYEARHPGLRCSMLELKNGRLLHGGAPSLPKAYCDAVHGLEYGPNVGSCGTSTFTGERVLVADIATDPKWAALKEVALPHGLRSCWSEPIKHSSGKVLGAFGMYYNHPALPNEDELNDLESAARLAAVIMEREQRESLLGKLHSSFEYAQDALIISDLDSRMEYVNPAFEKMTGYTAAEAVGKKTKILRSGEHSIAFYTDMLETVRRGKVWRGTMSIKRKDGSLLEVERNIAPVFDGNGKILCQINIQRDITEYKLLEEQFRQSQKMEALGTLVGGIAHDFNNILGGMTGNLYLAKKQTQELPYVQQKLAAVEKLSYRAAELIQHLLTFARKGVVSMKPLPLNPFIKETLKLLRTSIPENIELHQLICKELLQITGDSTLLQQVVMNLVNNARDAVEGADHPAIKLSLEAFDTDAAFLEKYPYFAPASYAHLSVQDNGCGIRQTQIQHLFEPFFTTKEQGKGTGLGLAMVFGAVKTHHGFIEVESVEGQGSTFHIYIPLLKRDAAATAPDRQHEPDAGHGELILLVDDELDILETGKEVLEALDYRVLAATNGMEAIETFAAHQNDIALVIMDVVMPKLGGLQAAQRIRAMRPDVKIVFSTGYDKETALCTAELPDRAIILSKPYNIGELNRTIRSQLDS